MLSKNIFYSILTQIPILVLGIISGVFSTRVLGEEAKGTFTLFQANSQLFLMLFSFSIQTAIVYFVSSKKKTCEIATGVSLYFLIISSLLLLIFLFIISKCGLNHYLFPEKYSSIKYLLFVFIFFVCNYLISIISSIFQALSKFKIINYVNIINTVFNTIVLLVIYLMVSKNFLIKTIDAFNLILYGTTISLLINLLIWIFVYENKIKIKPTLNFNKKEELKTFITFSSTVFIGVFLNFFNYRLGLWIINYFLDNTNLSQYALATNLSQIILLISVTIASVVFPYFSSKEEEEKKHIFLSLTRLIFSLFLVICTLGYVFAPFIIPLFFGEEFYKAIYLFRLLIPGILFSCTTQILGNYILSLNKNFLNIIAVSVGLLFTLILGFTLIPFLGVSGASIGTTVVYFIIFIITYLFVLKQIGFKNWNIFLLLKSDLDRVSTFIKPS